jgi:hypothetical protein
MFILTFILQLHIIQRVTEQDLEVKKIYSEWEKEKKRNKKARKWFYKKYHTPVSMKDVIRAKKKLKYFKKQWTK